MSASSASAALVVHYKLDDDGTGAVSTVNDGTVAHTWNGSSNATSVAGKFGQAGAFTTASDWWSNAATGADLSLFTFSMHINSTTALNWQDFGSIGDGNASSFKFEQNGVGSISLFTDGTPGTAESVTVAASTPATNDGTWHHLAMVSNGSTLELYIDGVSKGSGAYTGSGSIDAFQLAGAFGAGRKQNTSIDDVAIYNEALSQGQIVWLGSNEAIGSPIPEPSSTALLGLGGLALILRRRS